VPLARERLRQWRLGAAFEPASDVPDLPEVEPIEKLVDCAALRATLDECMTMVPDREVRMLQVRFGLWDGHEHTFNETGHIVLGEDWGTSHTQVARQNVLRALTRLRHPTHSRALKDFIRTA
jgi:RNA polymerase primary sigma factor